MTNLGGTYLLGNRTVHRMGYGAMQLAGLGVFDPSLRPISSFPSALAELATI